MSTMPRHASAPLLRTFGAKMALAILHSPWRFLLGPGVAELAYTGRRTGRHIVLPVMYARAGTQVTILAGRGHHKTWWRNFCTPKPAQLTIAGQTWDATAVIASPGTQQFITALALYQHRFPRVHYLPGDHLIELTLHESPQSLRPEYSQQTAFGSRSADSVAPDGPARELLDA